MKEFNNAPKYASPPGNTDNAIHHAHAILI